LTKSLKVVGIGLAALVAVVLVSYLALAAVSLARTTPIEQAAFFGQREGAHRPLVFAHQGGEAIRPTNTMIAFRHSAGLGADVLDTDMHMTSDGELVLLHDETVDRTSDGSGAVSDLTIAELRELDFAYRFSTDGGETFPYRGQGHSIVTVDELFADLEGIRFGIEIKQTVAEAATKLCEVIERFGYQDIVLVSSFQQANMDEFRYACPTVATSATEGEVRSFYIFQRIGLVGLYSPPFEVLQVPEHSGGTHVLTGGFVERAKARGLPIVAWTIDEIDDFDRMIALDIDGINTNYPDRLVEHLG
jgi:glycerophosphoryl diester phosphodiesterase